MNYFNSDYNFSAKQDVGTFLKGKKESSSGTTFKGKPSQSEHETSVNSDLAKAYLGVKEKSAPLVKELTDKEFEEMRAKVQLDFLDTDFNKYNVQVADKILSNKKLYQNTKLMSKAEDILKELETPEAAATKIAIIDKIISDDRLNEDEIFMNTAVTVLAKAEDLTDKKALDCLFDMVTEGEDTDGKIVPTYDVEEIETCLSYYEKCHAFLTNDKLREFVTDNFDSIYSVKSTSSENYVEVETDDKTLHLKLKGDRDFEVIGEESTGGARGNRYSELRTPDGSIKLEEYSQTGDKIKGYKVKGYIETIKDKDGNVISRTLTKPDKKNPHVLVVIKNIYDKDGNIIESKQAGTVKNFEDAAGRRKIQKEFVSPLGVVTKQTVYELKRGKQTHYEAGDKIFNRTFKIKDENTTESHVWGNRYETKFNEDNIEVTVTKPDGETETVKLYGGQIDLGLMPLLKQLPGDFLYMLSKTETDVIVGGVSEENGACYSPTMQTINISEKFKGDPFTFAHEYGHMLDYCVLNKLNADKELKEIFQKELDAYKAQASVMNEKQIEYFVERNHKNKDGCLTEVIAETNALLSGLQPDNSDLVIRAKILQENFPETISYIGSKFADAM